MSTPKPIKFEFSDAAVERLANRLADAQLPDEPVVPGAAWEYGTELGKLKQMVQDWMQGNPKGSDGEPSGAGEGVVKWWRSVEQRLNRHPHFLVELEGVTLHYQIARSSSPNAIPLIFSHGWPGSFFEADLLLDKLTKPDEKGVSFHVVVPSLVGYGMSSGPTRKGWTLVDTARLFDKLMTEVLDFKSYVAQGGDWGYVLTRLLALHPACKAFHTNVVVPNPPWYASLGLTLGKLGFTGSQFERNQFKRTLEFGSTGQGYIHVQSSYPTSLGYALYDSPVGVLSWILDKFKNWSDPNAPAFAAPGKGEQSSGVNDENILINTTIYYLSQSIHTSMLPYKESGDMIAKVTTDKKFTAASAHKPFGHSAFAYEIVGGPKSWIPNTGLLNVAFYRQHKYGGHFAGLDAPDALAADLREFFPANWSQ